MNAIGSALRYRRDVGRSSNLGVVFTDREGKDYFNRLAGLDGSLRITAKDQIMFQFLGSWTRYPHGVSVDYGQPEGMFKGTAFDFSYFHNTRNLYWFATYKAVGSRFRADLGFMPQSGYRDIQGGGVYTWLKNPGHWYTTLNVGSSYRLMKDHDNHLLFKALNTWFDYSGPLQSFININANIGKRSYLGKLFDVSHMYVYAGIRPSGNFYAGFQATVGNQIDFANVQAGNTVFLNPIIEYKWGRHLTISIDHVFERLKVQAGRLYTANLTNFKLVYQFNRRTFLRTLLQYTDFQYNSALYSFEIDPVFRHLFSQVLFSYKINPQTVLFLGYSDNYFGYKGIPLKQNNRTFFLKIGYALVL
jgi:hypothetical protein